MVFDSLLGSDGATENVKPPTTTGEGAACATGVGDAAWKFIIPARIGSASDCMACACGIGAAELPT